MDKLILATDHGAFEAKEELKKHLSSRYDVIDVGTHSTESCNYPEFAIKLAKEVKKEKCFGILLCGSGIGVSIAANRFSGIRAALCRTTEEAMLSRQHNNANVLCLGGRITPLEDIKKIVDLWLKTEFEQGRHTQRIELFNNLGEK